MSIIFMDLDRLKEFLRDKKSRLISIVIFMAVVVLGGYFIWDMSASGESSAILGSAMNGLTSLFIAPDDRQKEIISLQDQNNSPKSNQTRAVSSSSENNLPVKPDEKTSTPNKIKPPLEAVAAPVTSNPPRVLISELMAGTQSSSTNEFIEIYNPTNEVVSLSGFYIKRKATPSSVAGNLISKSSGVFNGKSITPHGFFLIASKAYSGNIVADVLYSQNSTFLADNGDVITLYDENDNVIDEIAYVALARGKSWERKAYVNGICVLPQSANELAGNGCDTGGSSDFVLREIPTPQNNGSLPEPKSSI
ncbi:MAG: lamin tail domain-containing protein [bacterium]|nr:lamin tail domain-containing protein [bacterium]